MYSCPEHQNDIWVDGTRICPDDGQEMVECAIGADGRPVPVGADTAATA